MSHAPASPGGGDVLAESSAPVDQTVSFGRRIADLARAHPDQTALVFVPVEGRDRKVTWAELDARANSLARLLERHGVLQGSLVGLALRNSPEHVLVTIGAWRLGACVLPLRWDLPDWERDHLLEVAEPAVVVGDWDGAGVEVVATDDLGRAEELGAEPPPDRVPDPAFAVATSGSTGVPKLIVTPGPGTFDPARAAQLTSERMGSGPGQVQLIPAPLYHTNGFRICHAALHRDEKVVLMERFDASRVVDAIERHRVTTVTMATTMLLRVARLPGVAERDLGSLQSVLQGASPCPDWLVRRWIDLVGADRLFMTYGASEAVGLAFIRGDEWLSHPGSVGRGLMTDIRVLPEEGGGRGGELPPGEVGEIFLRRQDVDGPTYEYRGAPPAKQDSDGFVSVGDLGWLDDDGYLYIADRRVDMIVTGGANVYPAEVEGALSGHPDVADVAVIGLPDEEWGRRVHAVVQPVDPSEPPSDAALRAQCRERLAPYKVPKSFELVRALPRSEAGKLNRSRLVAERS